MTSVRAAPSDPAGQEEHGAAPRLTIRFLIANCYAVGGTIRTTFNLAGELAKHHDVEIVSVQKSRDRPAFEVPPGVRLRALHDRSPRARRTERRLRRRPAGLLRFLVRGVLRTRRSRLIHPEDHRYDRFNLLTDLKLWRFLRSVDDGVLIGTRAGLNLAIARWAKPSVVRVGQEHLNLTKYKPGIREEFGRVYPRLDLYSALTERDAQLFRELLGPEARVTSVPNGVPVAAQPRSDTTAKVVIAAGRLTPQKGFDRLIRAWAIVAKEHPDWELRIFGTGRLHDRLAGRLEELGIAGSARLMGYTNRLADEMAASGFYVMSSRFEGFPMVLLEAMACGLPVVSFDCPNGPRDVITHGRDGFLVPDGDVDGLAAAMSEMIELGGGRRAFGVAAAEKAAHYELPEVARQWERILLDLTAAKRRAAG